MSSLSGTKSYCEVCDGGAGKDECMFCLRERALIVCASRQWISRFLKQVCNKSFVLHILQLDRRVKSLSPCALAKKPTERTIYKREPRGNTHTHRHQTHCKSTAVWAKKSPARIDLGFCWRFRQNQRWVEIESTFIEGMHGKGGRDTVTHERRRVLRFVSTSRSVGSIRDNRAFTHKTCHSGFALLIFRLNCILSLLRHFLFQN